MCLCDDVFASVGALRKSCRSGNASLSREEEWEDEDGVCCCGGCLRLFISFRWLVTVFFNSKFSNSSLARRLRTSSVPCFSAVGPEVDPCLGQWPAGSREEEEGGGREDDEDEARGRMGDADDDW